MRTTTGKILLSASLALLMSVSAVLPVSAAEETKKEQKPTYSFTEIVEPKYRAAGNMADGMAPVAVSEVNRWGEAQDDDPPVWGYINEKGETVVEPKYYYAKDFRGGVALVREVSMWEVTDIAGGLVRIDIVKLVDKTGKEIPLYFDGARSNYAPNEDGVVPAFTYEDSAEDFGNFSDFANYNGLICWKKAGLIYRADGSQIEMQNPEAIDAEWDYEEWGYTLDLPGNPFDGPLPIGAWRSPTDKPCISAFMDRDGNVLYTYPTYGHYKNGETEEEFQQGITVVYGSEDGLAMAFYGGYTHEKDEDGRPVFDGKCGLMTLDGKFIFDPIYDSFMYNEKHFINCGLITVSKDNKFGAVDTAGKEIVPFEYDSLSTFTEGYAVARIDENSFYIDTNNNRYSIKDESGKIVQPSEISRFSEHGIALCELKDGTSFLLSSTPVNGAFEAIPGSTKWNIDGIDADADCLIYRTEKDGKYGFVKLNVEKAQTAENPFTDVQDADYFHDAVAWALANGVTAGASATSFDPDSICTRGQVATFLWRAAGKPAPKTETNPFKDVKESDYFYQAVLWAFENGITAGTSADAFSPNEPCTTAQIITFLWRAAGTPVLPDDTGFIPSASADKSAYYAAALNWAFANGLPARTCVGALDPNAGCTRAQTVTFLYRGM